LWRCAPAGRLKGKIEESVMRIVGLVLAIAIGLTVTAGLVYSQSAATPAATTAVTTAVTTATATAATATPTAGPPTKGPRGAMKGPPGDAGGPGKAGPGRPPPRGGLGPERPFPMFQDVTDQEITDILAFIDANMPWMRPDLDKMKQDEPDRFHQVCRHLRFEIDQLKDLKAKDPAGFAKAIEERELRAKAKDLATKVRATTDEKECTDLTNQLRGVIGKLFDAELATRQAQIRQIEQRLDGLRQDLKNRAADRENIITTRLGDAISGRADAAGDKADKPGKSDKSAKPDKG
jgi:hypothetical protein